MRGMMIGTWLFVLCLSLRQFPVESQRGSKDFMDHVGAAGTQLGRPSDDPDYYTSNSHIPHLPRMNGFMGSHGVYRFVSITEQTATLIGEPKHGLWRGQESGFIREYRKKTMTGLPDGVDANDWEALNPAQRTVVNDNYAHYIPAERYDGYKYPDQRIQDGVQNFIDVTIYHPKYGGKYEDHVAIDMPHWSCTMSSGGYPHVDHVWKFAMAQPKANTMGPLGRRAGLDIKENYLNVLQMHLFGDASVWANVGVGNNVTDVKIASLADMDNRDPQTVNYQIVDTEQIEHEVYLIERTFFNVPYIFITIIMENKDLAKPYFAYLRPHGLYWDHLQNRNLTGNVSNVENNFVKIYILNETEEQTSYSLPFYGLHHPNRSHFGAYGGACPERGGDFARYPGDKSGGWWPTMLQEITPLCDAFLADIRAWANLWNTFWTEPGIGNGNAAFNSLTVNYQVAANVYGRYTDPYLQNRTNEMELDLTSDGLPRAQPNESVVIPLNFKTFGHIINYVPVPGLKALVEGNNNNNNNNNNNDNNNNNNNNDTTTTTATQATEGVPSWAIAVIALEAILLLILIIAVILLIVQIKNKGAENNQISPVLN